MNRCTKSVAYVGRTAVPLLLLCTMSGCSLFGNASSISGLLADRNLPLTGDSGPSAKGEVIGSEESSEPATQLPEAHHTDTASPLSPAVRLLTPSFDRQTATAIPVGSSGHSDASVTNSNTAKPARNDIVLASAEEEQTQQATADYGQPMVELDWEQTAEESLRAAGAGTRKSAASDETDSGSAFRLTGSPNEIPNPESVQPRERSVLDRIRGLAEPVPELRPGAFVRRQFERIPNPLNPLREIFQANEEPAPQEVTPPTAVEQSQYPRDVTNQAVRTDADGIDATQARQLLIDALERQLESWPRTRNDQPTQPELYRRLQLDLRMARLIADQPAAAAEAITDMQVHEEEFWQELILGMAQFRSPDETLSSGQQLQATVEQLRAAVRHLEPACDLSLRRMEFCNRIQGFGQIQPRRSTVFGTGDPMIIYVEVDNLDTELIDRRQYRTSFTGTLELFSASATRPLKTKWADETIEEITTSRRLDYFQHWNVELPSTLPRGEYRIRLTLRDNLNDRRTSRELSFTVQ